MTGHAGFATEDITPEPGISLFGYHRPFPSSAVLDRLEVIAIALEAAGDLTVVITVDNIGMLVKDVDMVRRDIAAEMDVPRSSVMVLFTHTHSAPDASGSTPELVAYRQRVREAMVTAARVAGRRLHPATIAWGETRAPFAVNRRSTGPGGKAVLGANMDGPVDTRIGLLRIDDEQARRMVGLLVIAGSHGNVLRGDSSWISGDYPGWLRKVLSDRLGCTVAVGTGCAGDSNPRWRGSAGDLERVAACISGPVLDKTAALSPEPLRRLWAASKVMRMRLVDLPAPQEARALARTVAREWEVDTSPWLSTVLSLYEQGRMVVSLDMEVQLVRINGGFLAGVPMEPFSEIGLDVLAETGNRNGFLCGYTNGLIGYLPTEQEFLRGGYEIEWAPVVYGLEAGLLMPPRPETASEVVRKVAELYRKSQAAVTQGAVQGASE
jgi:hypothetical protein